MIERTEEAGESGLLTIAIGGVAYRLRALSMDESDAWLAKVGSAVASVDIVEGETPEAVTTGLLTRSAHTALDLVRAYDIEHALPEDISARMTKRELRAAVETMVTVEDPFGEDAARSVALVFGEPSRMFAAGIKAAMSAGESRLDDLLNGASANGASTTHETSVLVGAGSSSSSAGPTASNGSSARRRNRRT